MTTEDLQIRIKTNNRERAIFIDRFDDKELWLSIQVAGGGANCVLTQDQAREMIMALNKILETQQEESKSES